MTQHLKPRSATVVIYQGDDMDQLAHLRRKVLLAEHTAEAPSSAARKGDDEPSLSAAQAEYDAFVDEAAGRALEVEVRSIGRELFRDLLAEHPPRMVPKKMPLPPPGETVVVPDEPEMVEHEDDQAWGVNTETYPTALLTYRKWDEEGGDDGEGGWVITIAKPEFSSEAKLRRFVNRELAEGDFDQLWTTAHMLNRSPSADPFVHRSTTASPSTDAT